MPVGDINDGQELKRINYNLYIAAFAADMLSFACGVTFSWTSPVVPKLIGDIPDSSPLPRLITNSQAGWIANLTGLGSICGPLFLGKLSDIIGRKKTLLIAAIPLLSSFVILAFAKDVYLMYCARFLAGIGVGPCFVLLPMYLGEIAEDRNRGQLGCWMSVFCASGVLYSFVVGPFLSIKMFSLSCTSPLWLFVIFFCIFAPESPVYCMFTHDTEKAEKSLKSLRNCSEKELQNELDSITRYVEKVKGGNTGVLSLFKTKGLTKPLIMSLGLVLSQQLSGIPIVLAFMQSILQATGDDKMPSDLCVIAVGIIQVLVAFVTSSIVERVGRKLLLMISTVGSGIPLVGLGTYFYLKDHEYNLDDLFWLPTACLILYVIAFNIGLGPLPWAILGEIFPASVKSFAAMITTCTVFLASSTITYTFVILKEYIGFGMCFWIFAAICAASTGFIYFCVIETKGKSLSEIQSILNAGKKT